MKKIYENNRDCISNYWSIIMGNNVLGPLVWTIVGIFLIIRANHKMKIKKLYITNITNI